MEDLEEDMLLPDNAHALAGDMGSLVGNAANANALAVLVGGAPNVDASEVLVGDTPNIKATGGNMEVKTAKDNNNKSISAEPIAKKWLRCTHI
mgnify:CR=1 FL=1